jgi:hypothetical protein
MDELLAEITIATTWLPRRTFPVIRGSRHDREIKRPALTARNCGGHAEGGEGNRWPKRE